MTATGTSDSGDVEAVRRRLAGAGYTISDEALSSDGDEIAAFMVDDIHVTFFASDADAERARADIAQIFADAPDHGVIERRGAHLYWRGKETPLSVAERDDVADLVSAAEGQ